jgi:endoplasmic reticulum junction formation protein lunapark
VLSALTLSISSKEQLLADIRVRERRSAFSVTLYALAIWLAYIGMWLSGAIPRIIGGRPSAAKEQLNAGIKLIPLVCGPVM